MHLLQSGSCVTMNVNPCRPISNSSKTADGGGSNEPAGGGKTVRNSLTCLGYVLVFLAAMSAGSAQEPSLEAAADGCNRHAWSPTGSEADCRLWRSQTKDMSLEEIHRRLGEILYRQGRIDTECPSGDCRCPDGGRCILYYYVDSYSGSACRMQWTSKFRYTRTCPQGDLESEDIFTVDLTTGDGMLTWWPADTPWEESKQRFDARSIMIYGRVEMYSACVGDPGSGGQGLFNKAEVFVKRKYATEAYWLVAEAIERCGGRSAPDFSPN